MDPKKISRLVCNVEMQCLVRITHSQTVKGRKMLRSGAFGDVDATSGEDLYDIIKEVMDSSSEIIEGVTIKAIGKLV